MSVSGSAAGTGAVTMLKQKMQAQKDELDRYRSMYDEKCHEMETLAELKNQAEKTADALTSQINNLEEENCKLEERLESTIEKLQEAMKVTDEYEKFRKSQENKETLEEERILKLEKMIKATKAAAEETDRKYEEVRRKLVVSEKNLEKAEDEIETAAVKIRNQDCEITSLTANLRAAELTEQKMSEHADFYGATIKKLNAHIRDADHTIDALSRQLQCKQANLDRVEETLAKTQLQYRALREEIDSCSQNLAMM